MNRVYRKHCGIILELFKIVTLVYNSMHGCVSAQKLVHLAQTIEQNLARLRVAVGSLSQCPAPLLQEQPGPLAIDHSNGRKSPVSVDDACTWDIAQYAGKTCTSNADCNPPDTPQGQCSGYCWTMPRGLQLPHVTQSSDLLCWGPGWPSGAVGGSIWITTAMLPAPSAPPTPINFEVASLKCYPVAAAEPITLPIAYTAVSQDLAGATNMKYGAQGQWNTPSAGTSMQVTVWAAMYAYTDAVGTAQGREQWWAEFVRPDGHSIWMFSVPRPVAGQATKTLSTRGKPLPWHRWVTIDADLKTLIPAGYTVSFSGG